MAKIEIETSLISTEKQLFHTVLAIKNNNTFQYKENDFFIKIDIIDNCVKMLRKNSEYEQHFHFEKGKSSCTLILLEGTNIDIPIDTNKLIIDDSKIEIIYTINDNEFIYTINMREV